MVSGVRCQHIRPTCNYLHHQSHARATCVPGDSDMEIWVQGTSLRKRRGILRSMPPHQYRSKVQSGRLTRSSKDTFLQNHSKYKRRRQKKRKRNNHEASEYRVAILYLPLPENPIRFLPVNSHPSFRFLNTLSTTQLVSTIIQPAKAKTRERITSRE